MKVTLQEYLWDTADWGRLETEVHVWCAKLDLSKAQLHRLVATLSPEELQRADRFCLSRDRRRFIARHGLLRTILAKYLDMESASLKFSIGRRGKPVLAGAYHERQLCFNISHSYDTALYAITRNRAVGVDIEYRRPFSDMAYMTQRFFHPEEHTAMRFMAPTMQSAYFFALWTCKEAYLKATGEGLRGLEKVQIEVSPDNFSALVYRGESSGQADGWGLRLWEPLPGYSAAVVVDGGEWDLVKIPDGSSALSREDFGMLGMG